MSNKSKNSKVTLMSSFSGEAVHAAPKDILEEALKDVGEDGVWADYKKMLIIAIDTDDGVPDIDLTNAGLTPCTMLVVSKLLELEALYLMDYNPAEEED